MSQQISICPCWNHNNVASSFAGKMIYKDECARSFSTQKSASGIDVCLKTLVGNSMNPDIDRTQTYSYLHYQNTQNPLVLRIKKVKINSEPIKVSKLAIGKAGGIDFESDRYAACVSELPIFQSSDWKLGYFQGYVHVEFTLRLFCF